MESKDLEKRLYQLTERVEEHENKSAEKFDKLIEAQKVNTDAIGELTNSLLTLVKDTSSIVQLHKDFQGAARVGKGVQGFMLWCLKWGAIGVGVVAAMSWVVEKFSH